MAYAQGREQGIAAVEAEAQQLRAVLAHMAAPVAELDAKTEQALVALMLELARRLVQQELVADPAKMLGIVRDAVSHLAQPVRGLRVRLNPDDARVVGEHLTSEDLGESWTLVADRKMMPGDCVVESDTSRVDARLDTRQAQLAQRLLGDPT
jgi:flagellar assembly protein FliH